MSWALFKAPLANVTGAPTGTKSLIISWSMADYPPARADKCWPSSLYPQGLLYTT